MEPVRISYLATLLPRLAFWIGAGCYLLLLAGLELLLRTAWIASLVRQQRDGLLRPLFDYYGDYPARTYYAGSDYSRGFDATYDVVTDLGGLLFYCLLVAGVVASVALWRVSRALALGVLGGVAFLFGLSMLYLFYVNMGKEVYSFSRIGSALR